MAFSFYFRNCIKCSSVYLFCSSNSILPSMVLNRKVGYNTNKQLTRTVPSNKDLTIQKDAITSEDISLIKQNETGALDPCAEDVSDISPFLPRTFSLAAYANQSYTLQQLVKMGVKLYKIENFKGGAECILKLDFEKNVKMHLRYLHDIGVPAEEFGNFITKNPFIFEQSLDDLEVRINYLKAKKFLLENITRIITVNPRWLNLSTIEVDKRLGFLQRTFKLSGDEVRLLVVKRPTLVTHDQGTVTVTYFAMKEEMGFDEHEVKALLLDKPSLFHIETKSLKDRFDYVHNIMGISHGQICLNPNVLTFRTFHIKERHEFLKEIGKAQYDPKLPGYVSLNSLVAGSDVEFCANIAKSSVEIFNAFLKTM